MDVRGFILEYNALLVFLVYEKREMESKGYLTDLISIACVVVVNEELSITHCIVLKFYSAILDFCKNIIV
jgi:hypothetical protein